LTLSQSISLDETDVSESLFARINTLVEDKGRKQLIKAMLLFRAAELFPCKSALNNLPRELIALMPKFLY
jgi:hypothetical protein